MNWTKAKDKLPELHKSVLLWGEWGHRIQIVIGALHDLNGKDGYIELVGAGGFNTTQPNKEYPDNLEWSIGGIGVSLNALPTGFRYLTLRVINNLLTKTK